MGPSDVVRCAAFKVSECLQIVQAGFTQVAAPLWRFSVGQYRRSNLELISALPTVKEYGGR